ncbi:hypothetical protein Q5P01_015303 [Channa striata]|uniref:Natterin-3-like n=1 Tax=Channa striata TaxID=64152 RepID=A0AA88MHR7_CHASR|nr:hypothetical protein Q5P01_015303 [Channa striata]
MMKLLLLLLVLTSVTHQESEPRYQDGYDDQADTEATIYNISTATYRRILPPANVREKRQVQTSPPPYDNGRLTWQTWTGSLPSGAVSINNAYTGRVDYVCKHGCYSGFYSPKLGSYCHYPYGNKEHKVTTFEILVNKDKFEILNWKDGSAGSVPKNSVRTCSNDEIYIGKNQYGLGMMVPKQKLFYLPWSGAQYSYSSYQVLTINNNVKSELIDKVKYNNNSINMYPYRAETIQVSTVTNKECSTVSRVVTLSKRIKVEHKWDFGSSLMVGIKTFSGGIPHVVSSQVQVSAVTSFQLTKGYTMTEEVFNFITVALRIPHSSRCKVRLMGHKFKVNIPFTARVSRTYSDRKTTSTSVTGKYHSVQVGKLHAQVDRCEALHNYCQ